MKYIRISLAIVATLFLCYLPVLSVYSFYLRNNDAYTFNDKAYWSSNDYFGFSFLTVVACCAILGTIALIINENDKN